MRNTKFEMKKHGVHFAVLTFSKRVRVKCNIDSANIAKYLPVFDKKIF